MNGTLNILHIQIKEEVNLTRKYEKSYAVAIGTAFHNLAVRSFYGLFPFMYIFIVLLRFCLLLSSTNITT